MKLRNPLNRELPNPFELPSSPDIFASGLASSVVLLALVMGSTVLHSQTVLTGAKLKEESSAVRLMEAKVQTEERATLVAMDNAIPDNFSLKMHEWDCQTGSLVPPVRTLGNPHNRS